LFVSFSHALNVHAAMMVAAANEALLVIAMRYLGESLFGYKYGV